jgi:hypothetical protein
MMSSALAHLPLLVGGHQKPESRKRTQDRGEYRVHPRTPNGNTDLLIGCSLNLTVLKFNLAICPGLAIYLKNHEIFLGDLIFTYGPGPCNFDL